MAYPVPKLIRTRIEPVSGGGLEPSTSRHPRSEAPGEVRADAPFADIVRAHTGYVWRVLRCLNVRDADVDDLCQETFIIVHRKLPGFEHRAALRSWIYGIALRVVSDYRARAYHRREALVEQTPDMPAAACQEQQLVQRQNWELLDRLLAGLADDQRQIFVLFEIEELTMREVCDIVGCPLQTAYSRLHAARKRVADTLSLLRAQEVTS
jgi:RNA polymerase sigma-70 factor (ECF subfamily)